MTGFITSADVACCFNPTRAKPSIVSFHSKANVASLGFVLYFTFCSLALIDALVACSIMFSAHASEVLFRFESIQVVFAVLNLGPKGTCGEMWY